MSKLNNLRQFYTLEEAASRLTSSLGEHVSLTDIYRFALDKHLTLSVRLLNQAYALGGQFVSPSFSEVNAYLVEYDLATNELLDEPYLISLDDALQVEDDKWLVFDEKVHLIDSTWDLTMIGMESLDVEQLYQKEVGGPAPVVAAIRGIFLKQGDLICKLQNRLPPEPTDENLAALNDKLAWILRPKDLTLEDFLNCDDLSEYLNKAEIESVERLFESMQDQLFDYEKFDDSITLEDHSYQFVMRSSELLRFVQSLEEGGTSQTESDKPFGSKERNTLLSLISALLKSKGIHSSDRSNTSKIKVLTEKAGFTLSENTIRKVIKQIRDIEC